MIGDIRKLVRYAATGALTTTLNVSFMGGLVEWLGFDPAMAAVVSTCTLLVLGYSLMNRWVFADAPTPKSPGGHLRRGGAYYVVILTGKAANYGLFLALIAVGIWYPVAWIVGSGVVFLGTFSANRWVWNHEVPV